MTAWSWPLADGTIGAMTTIADLKQRADQALYDEQYDRALALYAGMVELQPSSLDARLRVGDALMAGGDLQRAAVVYAALAKNAAHAGYPLRALVATKILAQLEPKLEVLLEGIGQLYGRGSERLGRSVRRSLPDPNEAVPAGREGGLAAGPDLGERAEQLAATYTAKDWLFPEKLMPIPVLSLLDASEFASVLGALRLVRARPGAVLIEQGAPGSSFFVLTRGSVRVTQRTSEGEKDLATLHEGAIFGEMALLTSAPRSASVIAVSDCDLLEFDRDALTAASQTIANLTRALAAFAQERLLSNVMSTGGLFRPLDTKQRSDLMRRFVAAQVGPGEQVIRQGEPGKGLYVVLRGEVAVTREQDGVEQELARLGPGDTFGEISLLNEAPTTATVSATQPSTVLFLGREYCARLVQAVPEIRSYLEGIAEQRVIETFRRASMVPELTEEEDEEEIEVLI